MTASSSLDVGASDATLPSASLSDAAASTPVAGPWTTFIEDAIGAAAALDTASVELSAALRDAATNYTQTETHATNNLGEHPR